MAKLYFAWVDADETTFVDAYKRRDERIYGATLSHLEGDIPTLSLDIKNPGIGLLAPSRKIHAWVAWENDSGTTTPIFFGRLVGIPSNIVGEAITIQLTARPSDFTAQKRLLAESMKVLPWYDEIFIDTSHRDDPDAVLEARSMMWHVDRVTGLVTASDILDGEDGVEVFTEAQHYYADLSVQMNTVPFKTVKMDANVHWTQSTPAGTIPIVRRQLVTYTGQGIIDSWPKPGTSIGGGWSVADATAYAFYGPIGESFNWTTTWTNQEETHVSGDSLSHTVGQSGVFFSGPYLQILTKNDIAGGFVDPFADPPTNLPAHSNQEWTFIPEWNIGLTLSITYEPSRDRTEHVTFEMSADLQPVVTPTGDSPNETDVEVISIDGADVGVATVSGAIPIGDLSRRTYFPTDRGLSSLEYLILIARAHLRHASRAVEVSFKIRAERAIGLSCRKNALVYDHRLPGGQALGKITKYEISWDDAGVLIGTVTMQCAIGYGGTVVASRGDPDYVDEDCIEDDLQTFEDEFVLVAPSDIGYTLPTDQPNDDGLTFPLRKDDVVVSEEWFGSKAEQATIITLAAAELQRKMAIVNPTTDPNEYKSTLENARRELSKTVTDEKPSTYRLELKPVAGLEFEDEFPIIVSQLQVAKGIDLEAPIESGGGGGGGPTPYAVLNFLTESYLVNGVDVSFGDVLVQDNVWDVTPATVSGAGLIGNGGMVFTGDLLAFLLAGATIVYDYTITDETGANIVTEIFDAPAYSAYDSNLDIGSDALNDFIASTVVNGDGAVHSVGSHRVGFTFINGQMSYAHDGGDLLTLATPESLSLANLIGIVVGDNIACTMITVYEAQSDADLPGLTS